MSQLHDEPIYIYYNTYAYASVFISEFSGISITESAYSSVIFNKKKKLINKKDKKKKMKLKSLYIL